MQTPLNPTLFGRLREEFGRVQTSHSGCAAVVFHEPSGLDSRIRAHFVTSGEYYRVNCPFCGDKRGRLWLNYLWGVPDEVTNSKNLWLAICYNEGCLTLFNRSLELYERVYGFKNAKLRGKPIVVLPGETENATLREVRLPGMVLRLDRVPANDPVCIYLRERFFDPEELGKTFNVSYCLDALQDYPMAQGRIVIPVYMRDMLVGWQCRHVGDIDFKSAHIPKYYSCPGMPRRLMLYNFDNARKYPFVVVCEGPIDVWNVGPQAVAMFGKNPSISQLQLICDTWRDLIIVLLDGDAWEDTLNFKTRINNTQYGGKVIPVRLPDKRDPGNLDTDFLWGCIYDEVSKFNIDLMAMKREENADSSFTRRFAYRRAESGSNTGREVDTGSTVPDYSFDSPGNAPDGA